MLLTRDEAEKMVCPKMDVFCITEKCMGWQWERLDGGGTAEKGYCGFLSTNGQNKIQPATLHY